MKSKFIVHKNKWDTDFFKEKIGNLEYSGAQNVSKKTLTCRLEDSLLRAKKQGYKYLVLSDNKDRKRLKKVLEENGFEICDFLVDLKMNLSLKKIKGSNDIKGNAYIASKGDLKDLKGISETSFFRSRLYKIDFVKKKDVDKYHFIWVKNLFKEKNSCILIVKKGKNVMGFLGFTVNLRERSSRINLIATKASSRGRGYGTSLINAYFKYSYEQGVRTLYVKTQQENSGAIGFYGKHGFRIFSKDYKYHSYL